MMMKTGMELNQDYTFLNYGPPRPQKYLKPQDRTIVAVPGMKPEPNFVLPGHIKQKFGKETPPDALIMDNLKTLLSTTMDKDRGKKSGSIVESFIKPRASTMFGHPVYFLDGPGTSISVSGPHEEFFNSGFYIYMDGNYFSGGC